MRPQTSRADLLRALALSRRAALPLVEERGLWWGFESLADDAELSESAGAALPTLPPPSVTGPADEPGDAARLPRLPLRMPTAWVVEHSEQLDDGAPANALGQQPLTEADLVPDHAAPLVRHEDLVPHARLIPALHRHLSRRVATRLDIPAWVLAAARRQLPRHPPREVRRRWHPDLVVAMDFSDRLYPYRQDVHQLARQLTRHCGHTGLSLRCLHQGPDGGWMPWREHPRADWIDRPQAWRMPPAGAICLLVGDLGLLSPDTSLHSHWLDWIAKARAAGVQVIGLVPLAPEQIPQAAADALPLLRWSPDSRLQPATGQEAGPEWTSALDTLLALVSAAHRVDPPLLRALRKLLPQASQCAGLEAAVWTHPNVSAGVACQVVREQRAAHLARFSILPPALQLAQREGRAQHHAHLRKALVLGEDMTWATHAQGTAASDAVAISAAVAGQRVLSTLLATPDLSAAGPWLAWARHLIQQLDPATALAHRGLMDELQRQVAVADAGRWPPPALGPGLDANSGPIWRLVQHGSQLRLQMPDDGPPGAVLWESLGPAPARAGVWIRAGTQMQWLPTRLPHQDLVNLDLVKSSVLELQLGRQHLRLVRAGRPHGASGWHRGHGGLQTLIRLPWKQEVTVSWAARGFEYAVEDGDSQPSELPWHWTISLDDFGPRLCLYRNNVALQSFRHIEPGTFQMGSPPGQGYDDEHPQHPVTITQGFWLADTPCTQAFWMAVMDGDNPSRFKDNSHGEDAAQRPVEQVSWEDVVGIQGHPGFLDRLAALLPEGCIPSLPTEAEWEYAARAGSTTAYPWGDAMDPQRANTAETGRGRTTPVKQFNAPNAWGLHDMHGNVWEWCADGWQRVYQERPEVDPVGPKDAAHRVVRGGSWDFTADWARSAYRSRGAPVNRWFDLGFRLALRSPGPGGPGVLGGPEASPAAGGGPAPAAEPSGPLARMGQAVLSALGISAPPRSATRRARPPNKKGSR